MNTLIQKAKKILPKKYTFVSLLPAQDASHKFTIQFHDQTTLYKIPFDHIQYQDFTQHHDKVRRARYLARATKQRDSKGHLTANNPLSANFWSIHLLW